MKFPRGPGRNPHIARMGILWAGLSDVDAGRNCRALNPGEGTLRNGRLSAERAFARQPGLFMARRFETIAWANRCVTGSRADLNYSPRPERGRAARHFFYEMAFSFHDIRPHHDVGEQMRCVRPPGVMKTTTCWRAGTLPAPAPSRRQTDEALVLEVIDEILAGDRRFLGKTFVRKRFHFGWPFSDSRWSGYSPDHLVPASGMSGNSGSILVGMLARGGKNSNSGSAAARHRGAGRRTAQSAGGGQGPMEAKASASHRINARLGSEVLFFFCFFFSCLVFVGGQIFSSGEEGRRFSLRRRCARPSLCPVPRHSGERGSDEPGISGFPDGAAHI